MCHDAILGNKSCDQRIREPVKQTVMTHAKSYQNIKISFFRVQIFRLQHWIAHIHARIMAFSRNTDIRFFLLAAFACNRYYLETILSQKTRFVQPGKIEIDANERAVIGKRNAAFSYAPPSILSLTIC